MRASQVLASQSQVRMGTQLPSSQTQDVLSSLLRRTFGYTSFRFSQREVIEAFSQGRDCFVCWPTGGGKSLTFVLPALLNKRAVLVVSPLISLMEDQTTRLRQCGVRADFLREGSDELLFDAAMSGDIDVLFITPEKLSGWRPQLTALVAMGALHGVAVDEAHSLSCW